MVRTGAVAFLFCLIASIGSAATIDLDAALVNAGFEASTTFSVLQDFSAGASPDQEWNTTAPNWNVQGSAGDYRTQAGTYLGNPAFIDPLEGLNVGYVTPGSYLYQDLGIVLQANTDYVLSYAVGRRYDALGSDYRIVVTAGSATLVEGQNMWTYSDNSATITTGGWTTATLNFNSGSSSAVGQTMRVWLANDGGSGINLYDVTHEVVFDFPGLAAVPEPTTIALVGAGLVIFGWRWRKRA